MNSFPFFSRVAKLTGFPIGVGRAGLGPPLPPNRAGGFPAHGSPVGGLTSKRIDGTSMGWFQARQPVLATQRHGALGVPRHEGHQQPLRPQHRFALSRVWARGFSSVDSPEGTTTGLVRCLGHCVSTFLHPLAPPELPGFSATMSALTPGRLALRLPREREHPLWRRPGLPALTHRTVRSFRLQPPPVVPAPFWGLVRRTYRTTLRWPPFWGRASLGLRHWGAGSPRRLAESSSLVFRTNRSPPVASHPASRRRSYHWLRDARTPRQGLSPC